MLRLSSCASFTSGSICRTTDRRGGHRRIKPGPIGKPRGKFMATYSEALHSAAIASHQFPRPGKLEIQAIKPLANQRDLALAYSPGVAAACLEMSRDPAQAAQ